MNFDTPDCNSHKTRKFPFLKVGQIYNVFYVKIVKNRSICVLATLFEIAEIKIPPYIASYRR